MDLLMKTMSCWQFTLLRIALGSYLAVHFAHLAPWAGELFGPNGLMPDPGMNPTHGLFPNPLDLPLSDGMLTGILIGLCILSLMFAAGYHRIAVAVVLWFGWSALFHRNNFIANPSIPYIGLMLILTTLVPSGEPWSSSARNEKWEMPKWVFRSAWILMAVGYTFSGLTKLPSASWIDGSAMMHLIENPLARPGLIRDLMLSLPEGLLMLMTWSVLFVEIFFVPLALWSRSRPWLWLSMVLMHIGIVAVVDFADLSIGMLMLHAFTFDPDWIKPRGKGKVVVHFDGSCMMCSGAIRFMAEQDHAVRFRFKALENGSELDSMCVDLDGRSYRYSDAVLVILDALGGHWRVLSCAGRTIPRPIRDGIYRFIASRRHRWFGKSDACGLPSEGLRLRMMTHE